MSWGVKTTCFKAPGVSLGGSGVSIGWVRSLRVYTSSFRNMYTVSSQSRFHGDNTALLMVQKSCTNWDKQKTSIYYIRYKNNSHKISSYQLHIVSLPDVLFTINGILSRKTQKGTWADEVKLRIGDELVSINGQAVSQFLDPENDWTVWVGKGGCLFWLMWMTENHPEWLKSVKQTTCRRIGCKCLMPFRGMFHFSLAPSSECKDERASWQQSWRVLLSLHFFFHSATKNVTRDRPLQILAKKHSPQNSSMMFFKKLSTLRKLKPQG